MAKDKLDKITASALRARKLGGSLVGDKIAALTAYDASFARLLDAAQVDVLMVGDSLGMVVQGLPNTLAVTLALRASGTAIVAKATARTAQVSRSKPMSSRLRMANAMAT